MARIRSPRSSGSDATRDALVQDLLAALGGDDRPDGPVVFEIAQGDANYIQVVVVWELWADLSADVRNRVVMDAYEEQHRERPDEVSEQNVSMILPVTASQAIAMNILPYPIRCNMHKSQPEYPGVQSLMKREGAIETDAGTELRLPTLEMAREARDRLQEATKGWIPEIHWAIWEQAGRIWDYN